MEPSVTPEPLTFAHFQRVCAHRNLISFPPQCQCLEFLSLAINGESGELASKVKKVWRGSIPLTLAQPSIVEEAVDAITYAVLLLDVLGVNVGEAIRKKFNEVSLRPEVKYPHAL